MAKAKKVAATVGAELNGARNIDCPKISVISADSAMDGTDAAMDLATGAERYSINKFISVAVNVSFNLKT